MTGEIMNQSKPLERSYASRTNTGLRRLAGWAGAWVASTWLMKLGPEHLWDKALLFTLLAVGLDVAVGVGLILAHQRWAAGLDELQRKIYLDATGITLGVTVIAGVPYSFLSKLGVVPFQFSHLLILTCVTFLISNIYGTWRYR
jgi:hypothetical protein